MSNKLKEARKTISELKETIQQLNAEIQRIDERTDEILRLTETWKNECSNLYKKRDSFVQRGFSTSSAEIQSTDDRITEIEQQLDKWEQERNELLERRDKLISEKEKHLKKLKKIKNSHAKGIVKKAAAAPVSIAAQTAKGTFNGLVKSVGIDKPINKNDINDTGAEGMRLTYKTIKDGRKTIKTAANTVKTVGRTIKTTERTIKTGSRFLARTVRIIYRTPVVVGTAIIRTANFVINTVSTVVAIVANPIFLILAFAIMVIAVLAASTLMFMGGGGGGSATNGKAQAGAVGLVNVVEQYHAAQGYYQTACNNNRDKFYAIIDGLYYDYNDLTHSDIVYMEDTNSDGGMTTYPRRFPTDTEKTTLKAAWDMPITEQQAIALAYVFLEKQLNDYSGTTRQIYEVTYTQQTFDMIINTIVKYTDNKYTNQTCPSMICTAQIYPNPDYAPALSNRDTSVGAYNDWMAIAELMEQCSSIPNGAAQSQYWDNNIGWRIDNWNLVYVDFIGMYPYYDNNGWDFLDYLGGVYSDYEYTLSVTPENIIEQGCDVVHTLHSVGIASYSIDAILNSLGFDDAYKQWYELTLKGFENNPNL